MSLDSDIEPTETAIKPNSFQQLWVSRGGMTARRIIKAVFYRIYRLLGELTAVVLGLGIAGSWIAASVLDRQSTDLTALRPNIKIWFAEAFDGRDAEFGRLEARWLPANDSFVVTIEDAQIQDGNGEVLERFDLISSTFATGGSFTKTPRLTSAHIQGGVLTYFEDEDGHITAGLGLPDSVGHVGPVYRSRDNSGAKFNFKDALEDLEVIEVKDAKVFVRNEVSGIDLKANVETLRATFSDTGGLTVSTTGAVDQTTEAMPFTLTGIVDQDFNDIKMRLLVTGARADEIAPTKGRFWEFQGLAAPVDFSAEVDFSRIEGLRSANVEVQISKGHFTVLRDSNTPKFPIDSLITKASLEPGDERMDISKLDLISPKLSFKSSGFLTELLKLSDGDENSSPTFNLSMKDIRADLTPRFANEILIKGLKVIGQADVDSREVVIEQGELEVFKSTHRFSGRMHMSETNAFQDVAISSNMTGYLLPDQFLSLWPVESFGGARRWIDRSILSAQITQLDAELNLDKDFFENPGLTDDRLKLEFAGQNIDVLYMETLPPATGVAGSGILIGNRLSANFTSGVVDSVALTAGTIEIPVLLPKGGNIIINAKGYGQASNLLKIADNPPFEIAHRYGVDANSIRGQGDVSLNVVRPLLEFFPRDQILYQVDGNFTGLNAPFQLGQYEISNGEVSLDANRERVIMAGPVDIGPWRANMRWEETFGEEASLTKYGVSGTLTADILDKLGFASRTWFDGNAAVLIEAEGRGMDIENAMFDLDLTNSELSVERIWMKPLGEAARFTGELSRSVDSGYVVKDARLTGDNVNVMGRIELDPDYKTRIIDLSDVKIGSVIDGSVRLIPDRIAGRIGVDLTAKYLNVSPWTEDLFAERQSTLDVPLTLHGAVQTLVLDPLYTVTNSTIDFSHTGEVIETARLEATSSNEPLSLELITRDNLKRQLTVRVPDASKAVSAFLGMDNTAGGRLKVDMNLPAAGEEGAYDGVADMRDFDLKEAPALAQLLSLASLTGLADTLSGGSMQVDKFKLPFTMLGDDIAIRDARFYGPALGMTGNGDIDLDLRVLDFDGTLVPAYSANSILGDIPVLGDIFVQEKDGGLFALTYTVSGPFEKTQIAINPLSALTPGFLRGIFKSDRSEIDEAMREAIEDVTPKEDEEP